MTDLYALLGVSREATQAEITQAYRRQLREHHPDVRAAPNPAGDDRLRQVLAAYALLRDPHRRAEYDRTARRNQAETKVVPVTVARGSVVGKQPPLRAGPVRWHRPG